MPDVGLDAANGIYTAAHLTLILAGILTFVGALALFYAEGIRSKYHDREINEAKARGEEAHAEAAKSNERAANLEKDAEEARKQTAELSVRAASLEKETQVARLEVEKLKVQSAWRELSPEVVGKLRSSLAAHPSSVSVGHTAGDQESMALAIQFANVFQQAGWQIGFQSNTYAGAVPFGLIIPNG